MLSNYFKTITRSLWRNKVFSGINIAGLAIGMASCLIILLYLQRELTYDRFNEQADRMVRVLFRGTVQGEKMNEASVMPPVAQTLKDDYPEVEDATRLRDVGTPVVVCAEQPFRDCRVAYADANFFQVFTLPLLQGAAASVLQQPHTAVLSRTTAEKYFGTADALGKVIQIEGLEKACTVSGIMENIPENAHFHFDMLLAMSGLPEAQSNSWMTSNFFTYLVLAKGHDYRQLEARLPQTIEKYLGPQMQEQMGISLPDFRKQGNDLGLFLQPLTDIHLSTEIVNPLAPNGNIQYIYMFSAIALFILLIACINFMNLSTAAASRRAREVGVRKAVGSTQNALITQFLLESLLMTFLALALALGLVWLALPWFNKMIGVHLSLNVAKQPWLLPGLVAVGLLTTLLAGLYPAFFLSSFRPIAALKGKSGQQTNRFSLRSALVVFQFSISTILIISTIIVYQQVSYIQNKQLGYQKEQVLVLPNVGQLGAKADLYRQQLAQDPRVHSISISGYLPAGESFGNNFFLSPDYNPRQMIKTLRYDVDAHYLSTLGMELVAGRNFAPDTYNDSSAAILNESAVKAFGFEKDALRHTVTHALDGKSPRRLTVIGVVRDFHFRSLHEPISPLVMILGENNGNIIIKADTKDLSGLLAVAKKQWEALVADTPFVYSFMDERFQQTYLTEQKTGLMLEIFSILTIFVACLGLLGLAMYSTEQRRKEIGIRKVLGASAAGIMGLLAKDFLKLVVVSIVIASPIAWYFMQRWLSDFAYRIEMKGWMFVLAGATAVLVAFLTVGFQSAKAALADPVKSLKSE